MQAPPSATTCGLPLTGAARKPTPAWSAAARTRAEAAADTVEQSTITAGLDCPPSSPATTSTRSRGPDTVTNTMSQEPRSVIRPAARAPRATSGSVLTAVRFHTVTRSPASIKRPARAAPMRPVPSQPRQRPFVLIQRLLRQEVSAAPGRGGDRTRAVRQSWNLLMMERRSCLAALWPTAASRRLTPDRGRPGSPYRAPR